MRHEQAPGGTRAHPAPLKPSDAALTRTTRTARDITTALRGITIWYPATADPPKTPQTSTRTAPASKPPIPTDTLHARRETATTIKARTALVTKGRHLHPDITESDIEGMTRLLLTHATWLAAHPSGPDAARELTHHAHRLAEIVNQTRPSIIRIGDCPETECGGQLTATVRKGDQLLPTDVQCTTTAAHTWTPSEWHILGRRLGHTLHPENTHRLATAIHNPPT